MDINKKILEKVLKVILILFLFQQRYWMILLLKFVYYITLVYIKKNSKIPRITKLYYGLTLMQCQECSVISKVTKQLNIH